MNMARKKINLDTSGEGKVLDMKTGKPVEKPVLPVICDRIQHYRNLMGMEQKTLANLIGVTANSISNWENGRSRPDVNLLPGICEALNITLYDIFSLEDPTIKYTARQQMLVDDFSNLSEGHKHAVENLIDTLSRVEAAENCPDLSILTYFSRRLAAGFGDPTEFEDEGEDVYVYSSPDVRRADCIFTVNGNSMEPEFHSGQDVLVQRIPDGPDLQYGEIGAFIVGNETYIKEYQEDGLHSLNPDYKTMRFDEEECVYLIGRVLGILDKASYANEGDIARYQAVHGED
jgi:DNA-binding XRE family transcriptional regulator